MPDIDIDQLLSDEEEPKEDVEEKADPAVQDPSADKKGEDDPAKLKAENERLRKATKTLNQKLKEAKSAPKEEAKAEPAKEESMDERVKNDPAAKWWLDKIDETASKKAKEMVAPIYEANFRRAKDRFLKTRPEYASAESKEKLRTILEAAKASGSVEEGELFDAMGRAWASENWQTLESQAQKNSEARRRAQASALQAAAVADSGSEASDDFTDEEIEEAARYGKSPAAYKKALKLLEESSVKL